MPKDEDLAALVDLAARLAGLQASLAAGAGGSDEDAAAEPDPAASTRAGAGTRRGCTVCERLLASSANTCAIDQFRLAAFAMRGSGTHGRGVLPATYLAVRAIASPLGIWPGTRSWLLHGGALESIGRKGGAAADLASLERPWTLGPGHASCSLLAERERSMITGITSGTPAEAGSAALCLRHLTLALAAGPGPETGRAMVQVLADAPRRNTDEARLRAEAGSATPRADSRNPARTLTRSAGSLACPRSPGPGA